MSEPPLQRPVKVFLLDILFRVEEYLRHKFARIIPLRPVN